MSACALLFATAARAQVDFTSNYPQRDPPRVITVNPFNVNTANMGVNRADCSNLDQQWRFSFVPSSIPTDAVTVEIWARADNTSCTDLADRTGTGKPQVCFKVASWTRTQVNTGQVVTLKPIQIVAAIDKKEDATAVALDPNEVCVRETDMQPTAVYLHVVPIGPTGQAVPSGATQDRAIGTVYDIAGPDPPTDLTAGAGNGLVTVSYTPTAVNTTNLQGFRAYCFSGSSATAPSGTTASTKAGDGGLDADDADATDDAATDDGAVDDGATTDDATTDDATTDETGTSAPSGNCPAGIPFVEGTIPTADLDQYICGTSGSGSSGSITITNGIVNGFPTAVAIAATDLQGNGGPLSKVVCALPRPTDDFYSVYQRAGGRAGGGYCAMGRGPAAPAGLAAFALALAFAGRLARRRTSGTRR